MAHNKDYREDYQRFSRADIEQVEDISEEWAPIDAWKAQVLLRGVTMQVVDTMTKQATGKKKVDGKLVDDLDGELFGYYLISKCLLDPDTKDPMYTFEDVLDLKEKSAGAIVQLATAVRDINGLGDESKKDRAVEPLTTANGVSNSS